MVNVRALQDAYNDAVAQGNTKLARELLALWLDTLPESRRRGRSEGSAVWDVGSRLGESLDRPI